MTTSDIAIIVAASIEVAGKIFERLGSNYTPEIVRTAEVIAKEMVAVARNLERENYHQAG